MGRREGGKDKRKERWGTSLAVQRLGLRASTPGARVQSLVGELRSTSHAAWQKKKDLKKKEGRKDGWWTDGEMD